ncbi:hypothetical protein AB0K09_20300, partial [Streptomyces sp. NPDC049577]|uniref:hypothetical protein n=1 Tax=Streptomyces sp. NPDC049577 TaxID=3155153 RepID=UPI0034437FAF
MTAPPDQRLGQLIARLRAASLDMTAEELADAVWLAQWVTPAPPDARTGSGHIEGGCHTRDAAGGYLQSASLFG